MSTASGGNIDQRLAALERRVQRYQRLLLLLGLGIVAVLSLAARTTPSPAEVVRTQRLEVVDTAGKARLLAYATLAGGRLEVLDEAGRLVFSAGTVKGATESVGRWERALHTIELQARELDRQRRLLEDISRGRAVPQTPGRSTQREPQWQDVERLRQDVDMQRRALDALERQVQYLADQVRTRPAGR